MKLSNILMIGLVTCLLLFWYLSRKKTLRQRLQAASKINNERRKSSLNNNNGSTHRRKLNPHEKRIFKRAQKFVSEGNSATAAQLLESIGLARDAIDLLEKANLIHEAAKMLMRMGLPGRAATLYMRNNCFTEAANCFKIAGEHKEAAQALKKGGLIEEAAKSFEQQNMSKEAAECYYDLKQYNRAARLFAQSHDHQHAIQAFKALAASENHQFDDLNGEEIQIIKNYLLSESFDKDFAAVLSSHGQLTDLILELVDRKNLTTAIELYRSDSGDIGPALISAVKYHTPQGRDLATIFQAAEHFKYSGIVLERLEIFEGAGQDFEKAGDFIRASDCYNRSGNQDKVQSLTHQVGKQEQQGGGNDQSDFVLGEGLENTLSKPIAQSTNEDVVEPSFASEQDVIAGEPSRGDPIVAPTESFMITTEPDLTTAEPLCIDLTSGGILALSESEPEGPLSAFKSTKGAFSNEWIAKQVAAVEPFTVLPDWAITALVEMGSITHHEVGSSLLSKANGQRELVICLSGQLVSTDQTTFNIPAALNVGAVLFDQMSFPSFVVSEAVDTLNIPYKRLNSFLQNDGKICQMVYKRFTVVFG